MIIRRKVGSKGQVVIPKDLRENLGIKAGSRIIFEVKADAITIKPEVKPADRVNEYISVVRRKLKKEVDIESIIEEEHQLWLST